MIYDMIDFFKLSKKVDIAVIRTLSIFKKGKLSVFFCLL